MGRQKREPSDFTKAFADRLSDLVDEKKATGLNHNEICEQAGVGSGAMSDWLSDNKTANIDSLGKLAKYFNVSADWLIGLSEARSKNPDIQWICKKTGISEHIVADILGSTEREIDEFNKLFSKRHSLGVFLIQLDWLTRLSHTIDVSCSTTIEIDKFLELRNTLKFVRFLAIDCISDIIDSAYQYNELQEKLYKTISSKAVDGQNTKEG